MAVHTKLDNANFKEILSKYNVGIIQSFNGILDGINNSNYKIVTSKGVYVLTISDDLSDAEFKSSLEIMDFLHNNSIPSPRLIKTKDDEVMTLHNGQAISIVSFLSGKTLKDPSIRDCKTIGRALADMHVASIDFRGEKKNPWGLAKLKEVIDKNQDNFSKYSPSIKSVITQEFSSLEINTASMKMPKGLIHSDLFPDNVIFNGDELSGIIDFYYMCNGFFAYDLAVCINSWCFNEKGSLDHEKTSALLESYQSVRPLEDKEIFYMPSLCRLAAFRFLVSRLDAWIINHDTPEDQKKPLVNILDPMEYLIKLKYHQEILSADTYGL